ncbi:MAG: sigma-70 family RNA polymerase sigma factor [Gammaproteobacteria bacterium]|nr:sigma-70 family RNA polymerase sigma factor [Gammaproteobacteria bacterium]
MSEPAAPADVRLAAAARHGDRAAFETLVSLHKASLYRLARRSTGNGDDAYDIVQDTFVSAWLALARFNPAHAFGPWIRTILLNKCRDFSRRRAVRNRILQWWTSGVSPPGEAASADVEADSALQDRARLRSLDQAIANLPSRYQVPLILTALQGLSHREAADQLGLTPKAVELRVHRARKRLQELLRGDEP